MQYNQFVLKFIPKPYQDRLLSWLKKQKPEGRQAVILVSLEIRSQVKNGRISNGKNGNGKNGKS